MSSHGDLRRQLRPHGMVAPGCHYCAFFKDCGGIETAMSLCDCFDLFCCQDGTCDNVCPHKSDFLERMKEVRGLRFNNLPTIEQTAMTLPHYIPLVHHGSSRVMPLETPIVALDTYDVLCLRGGQYRTVVDSGSELRQRFALSPDTRIILRGTAKDPALERYWSYRRRDHAPEQLAKLNVALAIGPNFSHFLDVPRTDNLFNRKRQLICLVELFKAGISPVPHLSAVMPGDWKFWRSYLLRNEKITQVAVEFQTGNKNKVEGLKVIDRMAWLQNEIGRRLHPIIIGAAQFVEDAAGRFASFTLIDSMPFMKGVNRQSFERNSGRSLWTSNWTLPGTGVDGHVEENIARYSAWIASRCRRAPVKKQIKGRVAV